ncbi:MAG: hypothetical protein ABEI13_01090 [Candidatus Paceibacteria bacterium]
MVKLIHEVNPVYWATFAVYFTLQRLSNREHEYRLERIKNVTQQRPCSQGEIVITNTNIAIPVWITSKEVIISFWDYKSDILDMLQTDIVPPLVKECIERYADPRVFNIHIALADFCSQVGPQMRRAYNPVGYDELTWAMAVYFLQVGVLDVSDDTRISCSGLDILPID